jgi:membrane AbrB-like protein
VTISAPFRVMALTTMGVAIGSVVGPETFRNVATYPGSILVSCLSAVLVTLVSAAVWRGLFRWPLAMSVLSAVPGSSSFIISVSMSMGSDAARVAVVQTSRVIFLVTMLPFIVVWETGVVAGAAPSVTYDPPGVLLMTLVVGVLAGVGLNKLGMAGGYILGSMLASAALHVSEIAPGRSPGWFLDVAQILLGSWTGSRFSDFNWRLFFQICLGATITVIASMAVIFAFAAFAAPMFGVAFATAIVAYAPGGQDAMMVLALALGVDPIFVSVNHLARYFLVNLSLPFVISWLKRVEAERKRVEENAT